MIAHSGWKINVCFVKEGIEKIRHIYYNGSKYYE